VDRSNPAIPVAETSEFYFVPSSVRKGLIGKRLLGEVAFQAQSTDACADLLFFF
jgi:hypothetical protein